MKFDHSTERINKRIIVIFGMHRSGTSTVSGIFNLLGFSLGQSVISPLEDNPKGFFENLALTLLNNRILASLGSSWHETYFLRREWLKGNPMINFKEELSHIIKEQFVDSSLLLIKDPRLSIIWPLYQEVFENMGIQPYFILCLRNPLEIAASLNIRNKFPAEKSILLWMDYMLNAEFYSRNYPRSIIPFNDLIQNPILLIQQVLDSFQIKIPITTDLSKKILAFIEKELKHHNISELSSGHLFIPEINDFYHELSSARYGKLNSPSEKAIDLISKTFYKQLDFFQSITTKIDASLIVVYSSGINKEIIIPVNLGLNRLVFNLTELNEISNFRFCPANCRVVLRMQSIEITDQTGSKIHINEFGTGDDIYNPIYSKQSTHELLFFADEIPFIIFTMGALPKNLVRLALLIDYIAFGESALKLFLQNRQQIIGEKQEIISMITKSLQTSEIQKETFNVDLAEKYGFAKTQEIPISGLVEKNECQSHKWVQLEEMIIDEKEHLSISQYETEEKINEMPFKNELILQDMKFGEADNSQTKRTCFVENNEQIENNQTVDYKKEESNLLLSSKFPIKLIAFYLPQFHPIPENDAWWGKGFTEWTNVAKAKPFFEGHNQPNLPADLGFYDLRIPEVMEQQIEMAKTFGIQAFCFHYYWFAGKRLLEKPLDMFLEHNEWNFEFCICWANENWSRRWDGSDHEILIAQEHSPDNDIAFLDDAAKYLLDSRYIRIDNKPLLIIYQPQLFQNMKETSERWRLHFKEKYSLDLFIAMVQTFGKYDPGEYNLDAAIEFPPHNVSAKIINDDFNTNDFKGRIFSALTFRENKDNKIKNAPYNLFRGLMLNWDNTPRKGTFGDIYLHNTPLNYGKWLNEAIDDTIKHKESNDEKLIFINAWNEWAEGAHLEPDSKYGLGYLKMTLDVLKSYDQNVLPKFDLQIKRNDHAVIMYFNDIETFTNLHVQLQRVYEQAKFDLYIFANSQELESAFNHDLPNATILLLKNQGHDIPPIIKSLKQINALNYQTVTRIQTGHGIDENDGELITKEFYESIIENKGKITENIIDLSGLIPVNSKTIINKPTIFNQSLVPEISWGYSQLFFSISDDEFKEDESIIIENPGEVQKFSFQATKTVKRLRFDPLNNYSIVHILFVHILKGGSIIDLPLNISSNALYEWNDSFLFDTTDPQVFIDFPEDNSIELDEVLVGVEYLQKGLKAFPQLLKQKNIEIGLSKAKTLILSESLQSSEYRNDCLQREVAENNILIRKQAENIGIQNGLLSSLKTSNEEILKQFNTLEMEIKRQNSELLNIKNSFSFKLSRLLKIPLLLFRPFKLIVLIKGTLKLNRSITLIKHSGYFDKDYYLLNNPDVKASGIPAIKHFLFFGGFEGRKPSKKFDSAFYLEQYPDVKVSEMNPLIHYIRFGKNECRLIHNTESDASLELNKKNSTSGPLQRILGTPGKIWQKMKSTVTVVLAIIKRHGGVKNTLKKSSVFFRKNGVKGGLIKIKYISTHSNTLILKGSQTSRNAEGNNASDSSVFCINKSSSNAIQFTNESILFIGHDALLAGAQILLLSLIKWFSEHTGIGIKIILLRNGNLFNKYAQIAPTLIWEDLVLRYSDKVKRNEILSEFVGKVDLVYGNTVVVPTIYDELEYLNVPFITHVHELEKSIKLYVDKAALTKMKRLTTCFIGCSNPVSENLIVNHDVVREKVSTIHAFIEDKHIEFTDSKKEIRSKLGIADNGLIVICCGTIYWRKGADLFVETAVKFKQKGHTHFHFYWIGENFWDLDYASSSICSWKDIELKILKNDLQNHITFLGVKNNVFDYLLASDIFYLTSREDPFPLVCLEAAQCGIPIICFADAGGIPDFVENDAGFVVPFEDIDAATEKIISLDIDINLRKELGATARKKFLSRHSIDIAAPEILSLCQRIGHLKPMVSVIVPNYNYGKYLEQRIDSILNQSFSDFEIIVLDDASSDNSGEIMEKYLHLSNIRMIKNTSNSGNTFKQWHKGFTEAKGDIIWFAEADDYCEPDFLRKLLPCFNNPRVAMVFCDSLIIDSAGNITGNYDSYLESLDPVHWKSSYQVSGQKEINFGLGVKNSIPNASAVLFRKNSISEHIFNETINFRFSGDWYFYTQILKGNHIAFCAEKLNYHRKHNQTVTSSFNTQKSDLLLKEASLIHDNILEKYSLSTVYLKKWEFYIGEQIQAFYPSASKADFDKYYPYSLIEEKINNTLNKNKQCKRLVFITTNDGSSNGGSEKLWKQAATECRKRGHYVMVIIKKWHPEPFFIENFKSIGISVIFKERDHFNELLGFNPDLVVISIGDQDEGIDYYEKCIANKIPYLIVNQLTKEPAYWPVRADISDQVRKGYLGAEIVMFTGKNNHELMERRINSKISNAGIFYNPFDIDRNSNIPFPSIDDGLRIALPANLVREHKGQHLAIELFSLKKWRDRRVYLNLYGKGHDEDALMKQAEHYHLTNVTFHGHTEDIRSVWEHNHAIFLSSFMEGLPLVLVGAMICGRVPIVTDIGAHREVIDDNISGFIAAKPTVEALDEALERAYLERERWKEIGFAARNKILSIVPHDPVDDFILKILPFAEKENN